jgi:MinD superfamily P-loop ATPase
MRLTIASGKGGVGKSMLASALSMLLAKSHNVVAIDCDVDAPNLALWLGIDTAKDEKLEKSKQISTVQKPVIDYSKCKECGECVRQCNFNALKQGEDKKVELIAYKCEGCGLCKIVCPHGAIKLETIYNCTLSHFTTDSSFPVIQGQIQPGEAESGEAVTEIRKYADSIAKDNTVFIQDAAAGIGCPVIASIVGSDYVIAVAEPSKSSFSDMQRTLDVVDKFNIPFGIVINKFDLSRETSNEIKEFAKDNYLGGIRYSDEIIKCIVNLKPVLTAGKDVKKDIVSIYKNLLSKQPDLKP